MASGLRPCGDLVKSGCDVTYSVENIKEILRNLCSLHSNTGIQETCRDVPKAQITMDQKPQPTAPGALTEGYYASAPTQSTAPVTQTEGYYAPPPTHPAESSHATAPAPPYEPNEQISQAAAAQDIKRPIPETPPAYPPRPGNVSRSLSGAVISTNDYPAPPTRHATSFGADDTGNPIHYMRDPHKLVAYLVPFPKPDIHKGLLHKADAKDIPERFLIYTPPPPPLAAPAEGVKEDKLHKVQRKWQDEVRAAKASDAKVTSWKGAKSRVTKGINYAMGLTTNSNLDFLNRVPGAPEKSKSRSTTPDPHGDDGVVEGDQTKKTVGLEEMVLVYPSSVPGTEAQIREEFVNTMLRSKSKAQRDSIIATGLLPVSLAVDVLATLIWPFGGLLEIDSVWLYSSFRGAKTARSVTKRLHSTSADDTKHDEASLKLVFTPSERLEILSSYLGAACHEKDPKLFPSAGVAPTETNVLEAIGWTPSQTGETKNWEDEQWEINEVKEDLKATMGKGAKEWNSWIKKFQKDPEKALKK